MPTLVERAQAQARYLEEINAQAKSIYDQDKDKAKWPIDLQGRILLQVKLDENAWKKIYRTQKKLKENESLPLEVIGNSKGQRVDFVQ